jgi:hypothetical protein
VLATKRGAVPEIVLDATTGFVRDTAAELLPLIDRIGEIDRAACRQHVAEHFSADALVRGYTRLLTPVRAPHPVAPVQFSEIVPAPRPTRVAAGPPAPCKIDHARPALRRVAG